jgi:hypothetical protein
MLFFDSEREAKASGMIGFYFIPGDINLADTLSKHWGILKYGINLKHFCFGRATLVTYIIKKKNAKRKVHQKMGRGKI